MVAKKSNAKASKAPKSSKPKAKTDAGQTRRGGARPGSGRKVKEIVAALRLLREEKIDDAEYAYGLFASAMRSPELGVTVRLECAAEVMNRVWGKPTLHVENTKVQKMVVMSPPARRTEPLPSVPMPAGLALPPVEANGHSNGNNGKHPA